MVDIVTDDVETAVLESAAAGVLRRFRSLGGAITDVPVDDTAYANRHQSELGCAGAAHRVGPTRGSAVLWPLE
jgi:hypothetical protein